MLVRAHVLIGLLSWGKLAVSQLHSGDSSLHNHGLFPAHRSQHLGVPAPRWFRKLKAEVRANEYEDGGNAKEHLDVERREKKEKLNPVTMTVSTLLFGFLVFDIVLLYLVNYRDSHVRSSIYNMISATVSIFCAVLMNQAVRSFFLEQILPSPFPRGFHIKVQLREEVLVGALLFVTTFATTNWLCWRWRDHTRLVHAVEGIGSHLVAFAGVAFFGHLLDQAESSLFWMMAVIAFAVIALLACRDIAARVRNNWDDAAKHVSYSEMPALTEAGDLSLGPTVTTRAHHNMREWSHAIVEAEDEATSIILSFLVVQTFAQTEAGMMPPVEGPGSQTQMPHNWSHIVSMLYLAGVFLLCLAASAIFANSDHENNAGESFRQRVVKCSRGFFANGMSWCMLWVCTWSINEAHWFQDAHLYFVSTAFVLSAICVAVVIVLDKLADNLESRSGESTSMAGQVSSEADLDDHEIEKEEQTAQTYLKKLLMNETGKGLSNLNQSLRTVIHALGLVVGLSWEKAFDMAHEAIIEGSPLEDHRVIAKGAMALGTFVFVIPAWQRYLLPMAKKQPMEIEALMEFDNFQPGQEKDPLTRSALSIHLLKVASLLEDHELRVALRGLTTERPKVLYQLQVARSRTRSALSFGAGRLKSCTSLHTDPEPEACLQP